MASDGQLIAALLGGFFGGLYTAAMVYVFAPSFIKDLLRKQQECAPLQYVRIKAKYK